MGGNDNFYIGSVEQNFIEIVILTEALPNDLVSKTAYRYGLGTSLPLFVCNVLATCVISRVIVIFMETARCF